MKALGWTLVTVVVVLVFTVLYSEHQARTHRRSVEDQIHNLAVSVERLATSMERLLEQQSERPLVEPIVIVHGDPLIGDPIETTWKSGTDTIIVKVYKTTAEETGATQMRRSITAVTNASAPGQYPPN